jgi:TP901 family phage tail tape measure protein
MANMVSSLVVRLIDGVTGPAKGIGRVLTGLNNVTGADFGTRLAAGIERNNAALDRARMGMVDAVAGFYALKAAFGSPLGAAADFESAMADVRKVVDFGSESGFRAFRQELIALSRRVPVTVNGLAQIAAAAGQAGIAGDDLIRFTEAAAKVGVAFDISADQSGDALAKMMTGLGITIDEAVSLTDAMNHLSNAQASSAAEILDVVRRVGAQAKLYGFTAEETAAFASAMISAGAESEVAATSFRNMGLALTRGASATKRQREALNELGLDAKSVAAAMQDDAVGSVVDVLQRLSELPKEMQGAIASDLFGNEARALGPLLTNLDLVRDSVGLVADEMDYAGSSFREFEVRAKTFENAVALADNKVTALKISVGNALIPALTDLMATLSPVIDRVTSFADAHPELIANVALATGALISFRIAAATLTFVGLIGRGGALSMLALGFNTVGKAAIGLKTGAKGMVGLQTALAAMEGQKLSGLGKVGTALRGMALAIPGVAPLGGVLTAVGAALAGISAPVWGAIAVAVAAVAGAGFMLWKYWDRVSSVVGGVAKRVGEELKPALDLLKPVLQPIGDLAFAVGDGFEWAGSKLGEFMGWLGSFFQREIGTEEQKAAWSAAGYGFADQMITSIKTALTDALAWFAQWPGMIVNAIGSIDIGSLIKWPEPPGWWTQLFGGGGQMPAAPEAGSTPISGARATGGPVWPGGSFLVGEHEPEIFTPSTSGKITPVSKLGGGPVTIGPFHITGSDPVETARAVRREFETALDELLRGDHSDSGVYA